MARIESDDTEISSVLDGIRKTVEEAGGFLNPGLVFRCRDGDLSILAPECEEGDPIIRIPRDILLPVDDFKISLRDGVFDLDTAGAKNLSPAQHKLADMIFRLYNLTAKADFHGRTNFWMIMADHPKTLDMLIRNRTLGENMQKLYESAQNNFKDRNIDDYVCNDFIKSRVLAYNNKATGLSVKVIMPVIDYLNHHWRGSYFQTAHKDERIGIGVGCRKPLQHEDNHECFASYRPMDSLDTFMSYGFIDADAPFVRSIPLEIRVPNRGKIVIKSRMDLFNKKKLVKQVQDLRLFMPVIQKHYDIVKASHLFIPSRGAPLALRRVLVILYGRLLGTPLEKAEAREFVRAAEAQVISENLDYYNDLIAHVEKQIIEKGEDETLASVLRLARLHKDKVKAYELIPQHDAAA